MNSQFSKIKKSSIFLLFIFLSFSTNIKSQAVYDTLYSYPDTTTFYNTTIFVVGDIVDVAVTFWPDSNWNYYQIEKVLLTAPIGIDTSGYSYFFVSVGDSPEDSIIYTRQVFHRDISVFPNTYSVVLDTPLVINNQTKFYLSGGLFFFLSVTQNLVSAVPGQYAFWFTPYEWIEYVPYYFNLKVVIKKNLTDVEEESFSPDIFNLEQNFPNPFNSQSKIRFNSPEAGLATLKIYDILGNIVYSDISSSVGSGQNEFVINSKDLVSGVYFYNVTVNNKYSSTKKMILLK